MSRDDQARSLAAAHYRVESGITDIYRLLASPEIESRPDEPIKLLEVNQDTIAAGIMPLQFAAAPAEGLHFSSIIVEVAPREFESIRQQELLLPAGWQLGGLLPNPAGTAVA
ncbi:MAG: hypothetical protein L0211_03770 [Planctomycetaceae bacterium]|nr:hypothetical protein [Planctomycetaceae bacterium]